jgi:hypothetical protein
MKFNELYKKLINEKKLKDVRETPGSAASEIIMRLQSAVSDLARDQYEEFERDMYSFMLDDKAARLMYTAKKDGVRDIIGWLADEYYDDPEQLIDFIGDWTHDYTYDDDERNLIYDELKKRGHDSIKKAVDHLTGKKKIKYKKYKPLVKPKPKPKKVLPSPPDKISGTLNKGSSFIRKSGSKQYKANDNKEYVMFKNKWYLVENKKPLK